MGSFFLHSITEGRNFNHIFGLGSAWIGLPVLLQIRGLVVGILTGFRLRAIGIFQRVIAIGNPDIVICLLFLPMTNDNQIQKLVELNYLVCKYDLPGT